MSQVTPPEAPPPVPNMGYAKAFIGAFVQPFTAGLSQLIVALIAYKIGHDPGVMIDGSIQTVISTPITLAAIIYTPHDLMSKLF